MSVLISILILSQWVHADWSNITATYYSQRGEDPGPGALSVCDYRVSAYVQNCRKSGNAPSVWPCTVTGYIKSPLGAYAAARVQCNGIGHGDQLTSSYAQSTCQQTKTLSWCVGNVVHGVGTNITINCANNGLNCKEDFPHDPQNPNLCWRRAYCQ